MRKINRNLSGITCRMTDLSGVDVARQRLEEIHKMNLNIVKQFEDLKLKFNDVLAYEALTLKEKEEEQKELFKGLFLIRRKKLMEALDALRKDAVERLWFEFA